MRIIDIGVATAYALLCVSLITYMAPYSSQRQSVQATYDSAASSAVFSYLGSSGLPFLSSAPADAICASLAAAGNQAVILGGSIGGYQCPGRPTAFLGSSSVTIMISGREVEIDAWAVVAQ